jgi:hypothetical protein
MNKKLREMVASWEEEHGETLRIGGATVPSVLTEQVSCVPAAWVVRERAGVQVCRFGYPPSSHLRR